MFKLHINLLFPVIQLNKYCFYCYFAKVIGFKIRNYGNFLWYIVIRLYKIVVHRFWERNKTLLLLNEKLYILRYRK